MASNTAVLRIKVGADYYEFTKSMQTVKSSIAGVAKDMQKVGKSMSMYVTAPLAALGGVALAMSGNFEQAMLEVSTLSQTMSESLQDFGSQVRTMSTEIPIGATDAAKALYQIVSAGHDGADGMRVLEVSAKAAIGGVTDAATAADTITTVLNSYKKNASEASDISDQLFTTVRLGKTNFAQLGQNIATVAPVAASFGVSSREMLAAVATLTKSGTPTAQAMTQIRASILAAVKVLGDGAFEGRTFQEALQIIAERAGGSQTELRELVPEIEALNGILGLTGDNAKVAMVDLRQLENSAGASEGAYGKMADSFQNRFQLLKNNFANLAMKIGDALMPIANKIIDFLSSMASAMSGTNGELVKIITTVGVLVAAVGPLALIVGKTIQLLPLMGKGFLAMINPITLAIAAVGMLIIALNKLNGKSDEFADQRRGKGIWTVENIDKAEADYNKQAKLVDDLRAKKEKLLSLRDEKPYRGKEYTKISLEIRDLNEELGAHENLLKAKTKLIGALRQEKQELGENTSGLAQLAAAAGVSATEMEKLLASINKGEKATGIVARLGEEIARLEKAKGNAKTIEQVGAINSQIEVLKKQIDGLSSVTSEYLALRAKMSERTPITGFSMAAPKIGVKNPIAITPKVDTELLNLTQNMKAQLDEMGNSDFSATAWVKIANSYTKNGLRAARSMAESISGIVQMMSDGIKDVMSGILSSVGDGIISMFQGGSINEALTSILDNISSMLGRFVVECGVKLLMASEFMLSFKTAIESFIVAQPWAAAAIAIAMIAGAAALSASLKSGAKDSVPKLANGGLAYGPTYAMVGDNVGAKVDPEVIAPLSKLKGIMSTASGGNLHLTISGKLTASGRDLALTLSKENYKLQVMGR